MQQISQERKDGIVSRCLMLGIRAQQRVRACSLSCSSCESCGCVMRFWAKDMFRRRRACKSKKYWEITSHMLLNRSSEVFTWHVLLNHLSEANSWYFLPNHSSGVIASRLLLNHVSEENDAFLPWRAPSRDSLTERCSSSFNSAVTTFVDKKMLTILQQRRCHLLCKTILSVDGFVKTISNEMILPFDGSVNTNSDRHNVFY